MEPIKFETGYKLFNYQELENLDNLKDKFGLVIIDEMAGSVKKVEMISPAKCRDSVEKRFSVERMVNEYENLFKNIALK
ncbi:MAG: hypothetical protein NT136_01780 [Candidatus Moranbacteria bacterium]|nr:hypothetical protein [Candidatus Moranbacteria bacterium]